MDSQIVIPGTERRDDCPERDIRYTPQWVTRELLDRWPPPRGVTVVEPAAGNGAIVAPLLASGYEVLPVELRRDAADEIADHWPQLQVVCGDWFEASKVLPLRGYSIVSNPPYSVCPEFIGACLNLAPVYCAMLLRLNHLGSGPWAAFWRDHPPQGAVVLGTRRPSFSGDGHTDASEYAWFIWADHVRGGPEHGSPANIWIA